MLIKATPIIRPCYPAQLCCRCSFLVNAWHTHCLHSDHRIMRASSRSTTDCFILGGPRSKLFAYTRIFFQSKTWTSWKAGGTNAVDVNVDDWLVGDKIDGWLIRCGDIILWLQCGMNGKCVPTMVGFVWLGGEIARNGWWKFSPKNVGSPFKTTKTPSADQLVECKFVHPDCLKYLIVYLGGSLADLCVFDYLLDVLYELTPLNMSWA